MFYPMKFKPVYKDYLWGGRNLEKFGRLLPEGKVAESWEISCHTNGVSVVGNGEYAGVPLTELIVKYGREIVGTGLPEKDLAKFPLLVKLIDANDKLSVQVHPEDEFASTHENGELGKNEMWYILEAKPGARLVYDVLPGVTRDSFAQAIKDGKVENCLKQVAVSPGDVINIPAGLVHAIGEGIILAEIQQNSDTTYRVYDYDRVDAKGNRRPLHIEKALEVIDFNATGRKEKAEGLEIKLGGDSKKRCLIANPYFSVELYMINGIVEETADGSKFYLYIITEGGGEIVYEKGTVALKKGESLLIPASLGGYTLRGDFKALKAYVPDLAKDVIAPLRKAGYTEEEICDKLMGKLI
jgi:mannose-6-phosphate isomerase